MFACRKAVGFAELSLGQEINVVINANGSAEAPLLGPNQKRSSSHLFNFETLCVCVCVGGGWDGKETGRRDKEKQSNDNGRTEGEKPAS